MNTGNTKWKVTPMLFSGRQNPEWELTAVQQKSWMEFWELAALSNTAVEFPAILGYTGCRLQPNEHSHWQLYNGSVSFYEAGKIVSKKDDEKKMELFLLNTAPEDVKETLQLLRII